MTWLEVLTRFIKVIKSFLAKEVVMTNFITNCLKVMT
jgi:hypothetical protein